MIHGDHRDDSSLPLELDLMRKHQILTQRPVCVSYGTVNLYGSERDVFVQIVGMAALGFPSNAPFSNSN